MKQRMSICLKFASKLQELGQNKEALNILKSAENLELKIPQKFRYLLKDQMNEIRTKINQIPL